MDLCNTMEEGADATVLMLRGTRLCGILWPATCGMGTIAFVIHSYGRAPLVEWFTPVGDEPDDVTGMWGK